MHLCILSATDVFIQNNYPVQWVLSSSHEDKVSSYFSCWLKHKTTQRIRLTLTSFRQTHPVQRAFCNCPPPYCCSALVCYCYWSYLPLYCHCLFFFCTPALLLSPIPTWDEITLLCYGTLQIKRIWFDLSLKITLTWEKYCSSVLQLAGLS